MTAASLRFTNLREALDYCPAEDTEQAAAAGLRTVSALDIARQFGATDVIDASQDDPVQAVLDSTGGGMDYGLTFDFMRSEPPRSSHLCQVVCQVGVRPISAGATTVFT
ncbi:hypothetical protein ACIG56_33845 [Nocardia fusca]|uniref:hypothetical protein n=1 Tax=Nocardia fusca TaxID=941183 RepID=UPI0037C94182